MKLRVEETRWHGCKYYAVGVKDNESWGPIDPIIAWTEKTFGTAGDAWSNRAERYYMNSGKFIFRNESDAIIFILKWS